MTCGACANYIPESACHGACLSEKFKKGYGGPTHEDFFKSNPDSIRIEDDEGWAFFVGKDFGCIHFELPR